MGCKQVHKSYIIIDLIGDVLASTLVMKLNDACREYMSSRKSNIYCYSRKRRKLRSSSLNPAYLVADHLQLVN